MKNLIYKEMKLSMHIVCFIFPLVFGIMALIPNYPAFVAPFYAVVCYPILFLGANKGQTTNDLFYTCNLPIRKRDVVKARLISVMILQIMSLVSTAIFMPVGVIFEDAISSAAEAADAGAQIAYLGLGAHSFIAFFGITILGYALSDLIFIPWFYKTGKSIVAPTLVTIIFFIVYSSLFEMVLPMSIPELAVLLDVSAGGTTGLIVQFAILLLGIIAYVLLRMLTLGVAAKRLEMLDL